MKNEWVIQKGKAKQNDLTGHRQALMVTFFWHLKFDNQILNKIINIDHFFSLVLHFGQIKITLAVCNLSVELRFWSLSGQFVILINTLNELNQFNFKII